MMTANEFKQKIFDFNKANPDPKFYTAVRVAMNSKTVLPITGTEHADLIKVSIVRDVSLKEYDSANMLLENLASILMAAKLAANPPLPSGGA